MRPPRPTQTRRAHACLKRPQRWPIAALVGTACLVAAAPGGARATPGTSARRGPLASSAPATVSPATLLRAFSRMPGLEARFVEEKKISLLAKPLVSRGRLFFTHPGLLRRTVESPRRSVVVVTPTAVHISANGKTKSIDLRRLEDVGALVQSLVWILAGNRAELERAYRVKMRHEDDGSWLLVLTPKAEPLSNLLAQIRISGRGLAVARVHVVEASGDETTTRITSADPARRFSPQEMRRLFTASAP